MCKASNKINIVNVKFFFAFTILYHINYIRAIIFPDVLKNSDHTHKNTDAVSVPRGTLNLFYLFCTFFSLIFAVRLITRNSKVSATNPDIILNLNVLMSDINESTEITVAAK